MPSENITIRSGINPSKFMGSSHAAGSALEERVGNNERKITLLKNIINYKDSLLPIPKPEESDNNNSNLNISDRLNNIGEALGVIGGLFKLQLSSLQDKEEKDRQDAEEEKKSAREAELEAKKATKSKPDSKLKIPKLGFFETLKKFFLNVALGAAALKLIEWFKNPANRDKILAFTNFLKDNAKAIFVTLAALVALDIAAKVFGFLATLKVVAAIILNPWVLAVLGILALGKLAAPLLNTDKIGKNLGESTEKSTQALVKEGMDEADARVLSESVTNTTANKLIDQKIKTNTNMLQTGMDDPLGGTGMGRYSGGIQRFVKGGRPPVGEVVSVGEQGRELFIADTPGTIVSNDKTENVFNGGALLVSKSSTLNKISNKTSSISQKVSKKRTPNLIDLRGKSGGSSSSNPTFNTGDQISSVPSEDTSNIDLVSGSLVYGLVG